MKSAHKIHEKNSSFDQWEISGYLSDAMRNNCTELTNAAQRHLISVICGSNLIVSGQ